MRIVEVQHVVIGHPDGRQTDAARAVQAELQAAGPSAAGELGLTERKLIWENVFSVAQGGVDKSAQVVQASESVEAFDHVDGSSSIAGLGVLA